MQGFSWKKMQGNSGVFVLPSAGRTPDFPSADENRLSVFLVQHRDDDFLLWGVKSHFWVSGSSVGLLSHIGSAEIGLIFVTSGPSHAAVRLEIQPKAGGIHLRVKNWKLCIFVATTWFCVVFPLSLQCCVHLDQPAGGGGGAVWLWAGGSGFGASGYQRGPGGALPDCGCGGGGGSWSHPHQFPRRETEDAPPGQFPGGSAGPHLCGLQHVMGAQNDQGAFGSEAGENY